MGHIFLINSVTPHPTFITPHTTLTSPNKPLHQLSTLAHHHRWFWLRFFILVPQVSLQPLCLNQTKTFKVSYPPNLLKDLTQNCFYPTRFSENTSPSPSPKVLFLGEQWRGVGGKTPNVGIKPRNRFKIPLGFTSEPVSPASNHLPFLPLSHSGLSCSITFFFFYKNKIKSLLKELKNRK